MNKEELKQEAEEWLNKWELCNKCDHKVECIEEHSYCHLVVNRAYVVSAEPREKRIEVLEELLDECGKSTKELVQENTELKADNDARKFAMAMSEKVEKQLREENAELKHTTATLRQEKDNFNAHAKAMEIVAKTRTDQLTKAIEIIKKYHKECPSKYSFEDIDDMAEQFLSEVENVRERI